MSSLLGDLCARQTHRRTDRQTDAQTDDRHTPASHTYYGSSVNLSLFVFVAVCLCLCICLPVSVCMYVCLFYLISLHHKVY